MMLMLDHAHDNEEETAIKVSGVETVYMTVHQGST
jgi:hypothetical protein